MICRLSCYCENASSQEVETPIRETESSAGKIAFLRKRYRIQGSDSGDDKSTQVSGKVGGENNGDQEDDKGLRPFLCGSGPDAAQVPQNIHALLLLLGASYLTPASNILVLEEGRAEQNSLSKCRLFISPSGDISAAEAANKDGRFFLLWDYRRIWQTAL